MVIENFMYPVFLKQQIKELTNFIKKNTYNFGPYQDAIVNRVMKIFLFHSCLSSFF